MIPRYKTEKVTSKTPLGMSVLGRAACAGVALLVLSACGGNSVAVKPSPLVKLQSNAKLDKVWSKGVGKGDARAALVIRPAVVFDRTYAASANGTVTAMETATGKVLWKTNVGAKITAGPGADSRVVAVSAENGQLFALDPETGAIKWQQTLSGELLAAPLVDRGLVVFRTLDGRIRAASAIDGTQQWILNRAVPRLTLRGNSPLVLRDERIYVGLDNGKLMAINQRDGSLLWESVISIPSGQGDIERMTDIDGAPLAVDGDVYVNSFQGKLASTAAESGRVLWSRDFSGLQSLAVSGDNLIAVNTDGEILAVDRYTSNAKWSQDQLKNRGVTGAAIIGDFAVFGDKQGYLHLLSANDGSLLGRTRVDSSAIVNAPQSIDGRLFVQSSGGKLAVYALPEVKPVAAPTKSRRKPAKKKAQAAAAKKPAEPAASEAQAPETFESELDSGFGGGGFKLGN